MARLVLGLDIGITSVGYGVIDIDNNSFVDYGVRLFKEGTAEENGKRREKRGSRRLKRRKKNRIKDMDKFLVSEGIKTDNYTRVNNPYEIRVKGLSEKLTNNELTCALLHLTKNRGSSLETVEEDISEDTEKSKSILQNNSTLIAQGKYICEIQLERLKIEGKVRGIRNNFKTDDYVKEAQQILSNQGLKDELNNKIIDIIKRRRQYYEGPGSEKSPTPYGRWIDYGVEPIDLIEKMRGRCSVYPEEFRAPKNSYTAELFNLLNDLNNLTIENEKLTTDKKKEIINYVNEKGGITPKQLSKLLEVELDKIEGFRIDKNKKPLLTEFKGYRKIKKIFDTYSNDMYENDKEIIDIISEIVTKKKGIQERIDEIHKVYPKLNDELISELSKLTGMTQYHSLSFKIMKQLNVEMINSEFNQMQLLHQLQIFDKNRESMKGKINILPDDTAILSPVVKRAQREAFKVINALRKKYGEFESIVIETTRDKNTKEQRKRLDDRQKFFENENKMVDEYLTINGYKPDYINSKTKLKVRLYLQQECKSAYTQQPISLNELINDPSSYEIDHIIPISVSLDDSINNKILATHSENLAKGNLTPIDAYLKGRFVNLNGELNKYKSFIKNNKNLSKKKKEYLLYEKDITKFSNIQEFIARNLVDTSYANRVVLNTLTHYFKDNEIDTKVHTVRGNATSMFRNRIGLRKQRDEDYLHHAVDALIVASIRKLSKLNTYLTKYDFNQMYNEETGEVYKVGEDNEVLDPIYIQFITNLKSIYEQSNAYYNGLIEKKELIFKPIKISHKIDTKPNRQVADETIYSTRNVDGVEKLVKKYKDIYEPGFDKLTNDIIQGNEEKYLMYFNDPQTFDIIRSVVMNHFETYKNDSKIYTVKKDKKGITYSLKGKNNPLYEYKENHGKIRKYSKKGNGPEITTMKYYDGQLGNKIDISHNYDLNNKKVVLQQISPYRTDFYISPAGKYKMVTIRYSNVFFKKSINKYIIDLDWYNEQKAIKGIDDTYEFVCSLHHDELIGVQKKEGADFIYDLSKEKSGTKRVYKGDTEILKFTATNNDKSGTIEVKPIYTYCKKQLMPSIGTFIKIEKYATDVLGNLYKVTQNELKLEFD